MHITIGFLGPIVGVTTSGEVKLEHVGHVGRVGTSGPLIVTQDVELVRLQWSVWGKNEVLHFLAFTVVGCHKVAVHNTCTLASCYRFIWVIRVKLY